MTDRGNQFENNESRVMTPNEMAIIRGNNNRGAQADRGMTRAVPQMVRHAMGAQPGNSYTLAKEQNSDSLTTLRKGEQSLMSCSLTQGNVEEIWNSVRTVVESLQNTDPVFNSNNKVALGNYYQRGNFCEFQMGMYRSQETSANLLDFKRMSGDGFVMDAFFRKVRTVIKEQDENLLMDIDSDFDSDDEDMILFDDFSDSEEDESDGEDLTPFLQIGGPLNLASDSSVVQTWIFDIRNRHMEDKNHRMGLMAYNASNVQNRNIIIQEGGQDLKNLIQTSFTEYNNCALVRNTAVLLNELCLNDNFEVDSNMINAMFGAVATWVPGNGRKASFQLTESRETVFHISSALANLVERGALNVDTLKRTAGEHFNNQVLKQALSSYVRKLDEMDVESNFTHITSLLNDLL